MNCLETSSVWKCAFRSFLFIYASLPRIISNICGAGKNRKIVSLSSVRTLRTKAFVSFSLKVRVSRKMKLISEKLKKSEKQSKSGITTRWLIFPGLTVKRKASYSVKNFNLYFEARSNIHSNKYLTSKKRSNTRINIPNDSTIEKNISWVKNTLNINTHRSIIIPCFIIWLLLSIATCGDKFFNGWKEKNCMSE